MIAGRIRSRRGLLGLSVMELARRLGVTREVAGRFESGDHLPKLETLHAIARALDVPAAWFFECLDLAGDPRG